MKILQLGAGSMGTRRLRDLRRRPGVEIALHDMRADRREGAAGRFQIRTFAAFDEALAWRPDVLIISTPPGTKGPYIDAALRYGLHHFSEADIWTYGAAEKVQAAPGLVGVPSGSMLFLPVIQVLRPLMTENLGKLLGYQFSLATYMPAWHPHEGQEYYARHRATSPAREMVPFELSYLNAIFGAAEHVAADVGRYGALPGDAEDTWTLLSRLRDGGTGQLTVTMSCPVEYRRGCCFGTEGFLAWDVMAGTITVRGRNDRAERKLDHGAVSEVIEAAYKKEINTFVDAVEGRAAWPHSYREAEVASAMLAAAERSGREGWVTVEPGQEPAPEPPRWNEVARAK